MAGRVYGLTRGGGVNGVAGVAFRLTSGSNGWMETVIHDFGKKRNDAGDAYFAPTFDQTQSHLYGVGSSGGSSGSFGAVFQLSRTAHGGWKERILYRFQRSGDGSYPHCGLVLDGAGNLYGTTSEGGASGQGTVFQLSPTSSGQWKETILYTFPNVEDGGFPQGTLAIDKAGSLYGIAGGGNDCGGVACGVVYKLAPQAHGKWKYTVLHKFMGSDGMWPQGGLVLDKQQKHIYGVTQHGGMGDGVVFEVTP